MHNIVIAKDILSRARDIAEPGKKYSRIKVKIGEMMIVGHEPADVQHAFSDMSAGTAFEGAKLDIQIVKMRTVCEECGKEYDFKEPVFQCTKCHGSEFKVANGEELKVEEIK